MTEIEEISELQTEAQLVPELIPEVPSHVELPNPENADAHENVAPIEEV